ncbi:hypothetical protein D3C80_1698660 [compost metagenome]
MLEVCAKAHCIEHVLGIEPGCIGHHAHVDTARLGVVQQAQQARHGFKGRGQLAEQCFLAISQRQAFMRAGVWKQLGKQWPIGPATDLRIELGLGQLPAVMVAQQLTEGLQMQGVGVGKGPVEIEQQCSQHQASRQ